MSVGRSPTRTAGSHPNHTEVPTESAPPRPFDQATAHPQNSPAVKAPSSRLLGQCRWGSRRYLGGEQTVALFSSRDGPRKLDSVQGADGPPAAAVEVPQAGPVSWSVNGCRCVRDQSATTSATVRPWRSSSSPRHRIPRRCGSDTRSALETMATGMPRSPCGLYSTGCSCRGPCGSSPTATPTIDDESPSCTTPVDLTLTDTVWQPRECRRSRAVMPRLRSAAVGLWPPRRASCR